LFFTKKYEGGDDDELIGENVGKRIFIFFKKKSNFFFVILLSSQNTIFWTKHKTNRAVQSTTFFKSFNFFDRFLIKIREVVCFRRTRWTQRKNRKIL